MLGIVFDGRVREAGAEEVLRSLYQIVDALLIDYRVRSSCHLSEYAKRGE